MRIIRGTHKGRFIHPAKFFKARPTTDQAKESLFNVLENIMDLEDLEVLDLFAGTGNISYEFASRGVKEVFSVEGNGRYAHFIKETAADFGFENMRVMGANVFLFATKIKRSFDLVFADPPFDLKRLEELPALVLGNNLVKPDGLFVLEHSKANNFAQHPQFSQERIYGKVHFTFFKGA